MGNNITIFTAHPVHSSLCTEIAKITVIKSGLPLCLTRDLN